MVLKLLVILFDKWGFPSPNNNKNDIQMYWTTELRPWNIIFYTESKSKASNNRNSNSLPFVPPHLSCPNPDLSIQQAKLKVPVIDLSLKGQNVLTVNKCFFLLVPQIVGDAVGWGFVVRGSKPCHIQAVDPGGPAAAAGMKVRLRLKYSVCRCVPMCSRPHLVWNTFVHLSLSP